MADQNSRTVIMFHVLYYIHHNLYIGKECGNIFHFVLFCPLYNELWLEYIPRHYRILLLT